jgi:predicted ATPase
MNGSNQLGNLPRPADAFVGRTDELARVREAGADARLVTVVGPGGVGKTRFAIEFAREQEGERWFVDLSRVTEPEAVAPAFLDTLGVSPRADVPASDRLAETLEPRSLLLVVDNCEQVVAAASEVVSRLVRDAPGVRVLATSRQALGVRGEYVVSLAPLGLPPETATAEEQRAADAVRMFCERAERSGTRVDDLESVVALCRRLDGIPLALELAAARLRAFSPAQILEQLDAGWSVSVARRDGPARHLSLEDAIDWSFRALGERQQALLLTLGTFRGAFDAAAAGAVADTDVVETADGLTELVDQSLVQSVAGPAGRRFRLLETVRAFTARRLDGACDAAARRRHTEYFAARVDALGARVPGPTEDEALGDLSAEFDDVQAAFECAAANGDIDTVARLAAGPRLSLSMEGARWAHLAARACAVPGIETHPLYVSLLASGSWSGVLVADLERARELAAKAATLVGDRSRNVRLCWLWPQATGGSFSEGADCCDTGAAVALEQGDDAGASFLLATAAIYRLAAGDERSAIEAAERALLLARQTRSRSLQTRAAGALAYALQDVDATAARRAAEEALETGNPGDFNLTMPLRVLATVAWREGDGPTAADHAGLVAALIRDQGDRYVQAAATRQFAVLIGRVDLPLAAELLGIADALLPEVRVMARDEIAGDRLRAELLQSLGADALAASLDRARRYDARAVYGIVDRALAVMRAERVGDDQVADVASPADAAASSRHRAGAPSPGR